MAGFLQRIIRNGTRPLPAPPRTRRQPPTIALDVNHVVEPPRADAQPRETAAADPPNALPEPARATPPKSTAEPAPMPDRTGASAPRLEQPPRAHDSPAARPAPSANADRGPIAGSVTAMEASEARAADHATFTARPLRAAPESRRAAASPAPVDSKGQTEPPAARASLPPTPARRSTPAEQPVDEEAVFRARPRKLPEPSPLVGEAHPADQPGRQSETGPAAISEHLQTVVSWIESQVSESPPSPRVDLRAAIAPRADMTADNEPDRPGAVLHDRPAAVPPPPPPSQAFERGADSPEQAVSGPRPPARQAMDGHPRQTMQAERQPAGSRLTINHLNVQIVNEDRSPRKEPPRPSTSAPGRAEWGVFERRHLRIP